MENKKSPKKKSGKDTGKKPNNDKAAKSAVNNQWTNANVRYSPDNGERRDGPGGSGNTQG